jgi:hypothetical protein
MLPKNKWIPRSILFNFIVVIILILVGRFTSLNSEGVLNIVAGMLMGGIFNTIFERILVFNRAVKLRYFLKGFEIGFLFLFIVLSFLIIGNRVINPGRMLLSCAYGVGLGLIWGFLDYLITENRERKHPFTGNEKPLLKFKANIYFFGQIHGRGIILLLSDRLLFIGDDSENREIMLDEIEDLLVQSTILFPNRLTLILENAGFVSINVSMPYLWRKNIMAKGRRQKAEGSWE